MGRGIIAIFSMFQGPITDISTDKHTYIRTIQTNIFYSFLGFPPIVDELSTASRPLRRQEFTYCDITFPEEHANQTARPTNQVALNSNGIQAPESLDLGEGKYWAKFVSNFQASRLPGFQASRLPGFQASRLVPGFQAHYVV